jgi:hypothetical protein
MIKTFDLRAEEQKAFELKDRCERIGGLAFRIKLYMDITGAFQYNNDV